MAGLSHDDAAVDPTPHPSETVHDAAPPAGIDMVEVGSQAQDMLQQFLTEPPTPGDPGT